MTEAASSLPCRRFLHAAVSPFHSLSSICFMHLFHRRVVDSAIPLRSAIPLHAVDLALDRRFLRAVDSLPFSVVSVSPISLWSLLSSLPPCLTVEVDKVLLETPEDEIDERKLRIKDLILLVEARERMSEPQFSCPLQPTPCSLRNLLWRE